MAKLKITNLSRVKTDIRKKMTKALRNPDIRDGVGEIVVDQIQKERKPVTSAATKAWRKYLERGNKTSNRYNSNYINMTFTGDLLKDLKDNIKARFVRGEVEYVIEQSDKKHKKYKKPDGKPVTGQSKSFKQISEYLNKNGHEYLIFSNKSKKRVIEYIRDKVFNMIK